MDEKTLLEAVEQLNDARQVEADYGLALADAEAHVGRIRAISVAAWYQAGKIDGKNEAQRKVQELDLLAGSEHVKKAEADLRLATSKHGAARIEREYRQDRYRAMLALMGSRNGE